MDIIAEIKELKKKREQAQMLLTKHRTQLETLTEQREQLITELKDKYGVTVDTASQMVEDLTKSLNSKLAEAKEVLNKIALQ